MRRFQADSRFIRGKSPVWQKGRLKTGLAKKTLFSDGLLPMDAVQSVVYFQ